MTLVEMGNSHTMTVSADGQRRLLEGERVTSVRIPADWPLDAAVAAVVASWGQHSQPGFDPVWLECNDTGLTDALSERFCLSANQLVRPADWGASVGSRYSAASESEAEPMIVEAEANQMVMDVVGRAL